MAMCNPRQLLREKLHIASIHWCYRCYVRSSLVVEARVSICAWHNFFLGTGKKIYKQEFISRVTKLGLYLC